MFADRRHGARVGGRRARRMPGRGEQTLQPGSEHDVLDAEPIDHRGQRRSPPKDIGEHALSVFGDLEVPIERPPERPEGRGDHFRVAAVARRRTPAGQPPGGRTPPAAPAGDRPRAERSTWIHARSRRWTRRTSFSDEHHCDDRRARCAGPVVPAGSGRVVDGATRDSARRARRKASPGRAERPYVGRRGAGHAPKCSFAKGETGDGIRIRAATRHLPRGRRQRLRATRSPMTTSVTSARST